MAANQCQRLECMKELIKSARSNRYSSLRKLASEDQDVYNIWDHISQLVEMHMSQRKAVHIPGLGIFTFTSSKLDVGHNKFILIQRPVFILSERLVRTHRLTQSKYHVSGEIPVIQLNLTSLAYDINVERDLVEASVKEVINTLSRSIEKLCSCEFAFTTIGNLVISKGSAKMKFLPSFLEKMDSTGGLTRYLIQRPETSSSFLSDNSLILPKIQPGEDVNRKPKFTEFESIKEEEEENANTDGVSPHSKTTSPTTTTTNKKEALTPTLKVKPTTPVIQHLTLIQDEPKPSSPYVPAATTARKALQNLKRTIAFKDSRNECDSLKKLGRVFPTQRVSQMNLIKALKKTPEPKQSPNSQSGDSRCSNCVESMNDFCYLCYQREKRNVPVFLAVEREEEEQEEDHALQMYTLLKDNELLKKEEDLKNKKREESRNNAAFNLNASEEKKGKQDKEGKVQFQRSFVFQQRPVTPPHYIKQELYQTELAKQVAEKTKNAVTAKQEKDVLERLEQLQLAEDLALQRDHYLKSKRLQSEQYRKALDTQVYIKKCLEERYQDSRPSANHRFSLPRPNVLLPFQRIQSSNPINTMAYKASEIPTAYPDSDAPIFGVHDSSTERRQAQKKRAQKLYQQQLIMAAERRKAEIAQCGKKHRKEVDMLRKTKAELLQETLARNQQNLQQRQDLEKTWISQAIKKKEREFEEKLRTKSPGLLLQEQCDKYTRCAQCTNHSENVGKSNVWSESRYVSGSRLMV